MVPVERAEMDLPRQLDQIGPDEKPVGVGWREVLDDGNVGKIEAEAKLFARRLFIKRGDLINLLGRFRAGVAMHFQVGVEPHFLRVGFHLDPDFDGLAGRGVVIAELHIDPRGLARLGRFEPLGVLQVSVKIADIIHPIFLAKRYNVGHGAAADGIKPGLLGLLEFFFKGPFLGRGGLVGQRPKTGEMF